MVTITLNTHDVDACDAFTRVLIRSWEVFPHALISGSHELSGAISNASRRPPQVIKSLVTTQFPLRITTFASEARSFLTTK